MKCRLLDQIPRGGDWVYEIKFDGYRGLAIKNQDLVRLLSRNRQDLGARFPGILRALRDLPFEQFVLDGEIVALDEQGRSSFQWLQRAGEPNSKKGALFYYAFDLLNLNGKDTTGLPLTRRKALLRHVLRGGPDCIRFSSSLHGDPAELSAAMRRLGLEGLIAKRKDSRYEPGQRSGAWIKFKWCNEQEFVIGGYTDPKGSRPYFGSVLVGYYRREKLIFAAKVGTGFDARQLKSLYDRFQALRTGECPFANLPERDGVITRAQMRFCHWVKPQLVCQVRFSEWTEDGHLRQPVFLGLREDKRPAEVIRER